MTKLYIAGPMSGHPGYNYAAFNRAQTALESLGFAVLNPTGGYETPELLADATGFRGTEWLDYMRRDIELLLIADGVALLPGWETSRGATVENDLARSLGMDVGPLDVWIAAGIITAS